MDQTAPGIDDIAEIAARTIRELPAPFADLAKDIVLHVTEFADEALLNEMESHPYDLTGLYDGIPLTQKSSMDQPEGPDTIWLFRRAILDEWADRGNVTVTELVAHVTIHEVAHHFGWSDDDIAAIDEWWT